MRAGLCLLGLRSRLGTGLYAGYAAAAPVPRGILQPARARWLGRTHAAPQAAKRAVVNAARCSTLTRHSSLLRSALRSGDAARLAMVVEAAKKDSVPKAVIDKALDTSHSANAEVMVVEVSAPGGTLLLVTAFSANRAALVQKMNQVFNRQEVGALAAALWAFEKEASFLVPSATLARDALELVAIEHGADDLRDDAEGARVVCIGDDADHRITRLLVEVAAASGSPAMEAETSYSASNLVSLNNDGLHLVNNLIEALSGLDDVEQVFTNLSDVTDDPSE
mmetsp:Transcript_28596/g.71984  ORF Transcript_28596/g.71984 Transcript_28596/m.71984 type:complete len:280 (-) Transcript_28596:93-932(-)